MRHRSDWNTHSSVLLLQEEESVWSAEAAVGVLATTLAIREGLERAGYRVVEVPVSSPQALIRALEPFDPHEHVVFNWYEGVEPGARDCIQVAAILESLGYAYTGADARALLSAQDKIHTSRLLQEYGIPTPATQAFSEEDAEEWQHYPAIVKIANEHGSECLTEASVVHDCESLRRKAEELATIERRLMVSEFIAGREFSVALWGDGNVEALPVVEIDYSAFPPERPRLRTSDAKWDTNSDVYNEIRVVCQPPLPVTLQDRIEQVACAAYQACRLRDYGRIDLRLCDEEPFVIDVNANPDIAGDGSFVLAAERAGYDYSAMLDRIVRLATRRARA